MCCEHTIITYLILIFMINVLRTCHDHPILVILVIYVLRTCCDYSFELFMIYVLQTCHDHFILIHSCDLCVANMPWLLIWMFLPFWCHVHSSNLSAVNMPWLHCLNILFAFILVLVIYVLRTCRDYLFECLLLWYKMWLKYIFPWKL